MPVSASPARIARSIGAAPRQRGSSEACRLMQPRRGASRTGARQQQAVGADHREIGAEGCEFGLGLGVLQRARRADVQAQPLGRLVHGRAAQLVAAAGRAAAAGCRPRRSSWPAASSASRLGSTKPVVPMTTSRSRCSGTRAPRLDQLAHDHVALAARTGGRRTGRRRDGRSRAGRSGPAGPRPRARAPRHARSGERTLTACGRVTSANWPGRLRQPSSAVARSPERQTISGLTSTIGRRSSPSATSSTTSRSETPTCGAASPMPGALYMVSNMSAASWRSASSTRATGSALVLSTGCGACRISSRAMAVSSSRGGKAAVR